MSNFEFKDCPCCNGKGHVTHRVPGDHYEMLCDCCGGEGTVVEEQVETPEEKFKRVKTAFEAKKQVYMLGGQNCSYEELRQAAQEVVSAYNLVAEQIAKKFGRRPKYLSLNSLMH